MEILTMFLSTVVGVVVMYTILGTLHEAAKAGDFKEKFTFFLFSVLVCGMVLFYMAQEFYRELF